MPLVYAASMRSDFPDLATATLRGSGLTAHAAASAEVSYFVAIAASRLNSATAANFPEVQAWRRPFGRMGPKPTQHRCASEALLRRLRKEGALPCLHPLVDVCNAAAVALAIPIAAFDLAFVTGRLEVRRATGREVYETFAGDKEHPDPGEVIFADSDGHAHARRWTHRQSGRSAVRAGTADALIVAEALHATAAQDVARLMTEVRRAVALLWPSATLTAVAVS